MSESFTARYVPQSRLHRLLLRLEGGAQSGGVLMTKSQLYALLLKCNGAQLDALVATLGLNTAFLPPREQANATRASGILELAEPRGLLPALEAALLEYFPAAPTGNADAKPRVKHILILSANPAETDRLGIDEEVRLIKQRLGEGAPGREYRVESEWAVRPSDLSRFLLDYEPEIVHFSGHGSPTGDIVLVNERGDAAPVSVNVLANLFGILAGRTECIVLNACYSGEQARALANHVGCVVGMERAIGDASALRFAAGFYRGIAYGKDYHTAFRLASNEIDLLALPDATVPHFMTRDEDQVATSTKVAGGADDAVRPVVRTWIPPGAPARGPDSPKLFPVWFGTNRRPVDPADPSKGFSGERDDGTVHYGVCKVAVPKSHKFGEVGSAWWRRLLTLTDDRLAVKERSVLQAAAFWQSAREALLEWDTQERMALIFIHGFRVSFDEAAIRAAQFGVDLKITGVTAFFSWPSRGKLSLRDYTADEASVEASEKQISEFLVGFAQATDAQRVQVIAHSMGNRGLLRAMQRIVPAAAAAAKKPFHQIIFAAPDVDTDVFRDLSQSHALLAQHATLYLSSHDRAVASSGLLHQAPRAGFVPPVTLVPGIDVVDVTDADLTLLGHGYYGAAEGVLYDIHELLAHDTPPGARLKLTAPPEPEAGYWRIGK
jgi:esterase/lipase superfamily enzyme